MMRVRLREQHEDEMTFYRDRYPNGYHHAMWPDHVERVKASVEFIRKYVPGTLRSAADLSCGDGAVLGQIRAAYKIYGDLNLTVEPADANELIDGSLPDGLNCYDGTTDLLICSETLEHLNDPDNFLYRAKHKTDWIFISTPDGETVPDDPRGGNHEHYWGWDTAAVRIMLESTGWSIKAHEVFKPVSADVYTFQFWLAR